jgi:hypothetical protein
MTTDISSVLASLETCKQTALSRAADLHAEASRIDVAIRALQTNGVAKPVAAPPGHAAKNGANGHVEKPQTQANIILSTLKNLGSSRRLDVLSAISVAHPGINMSSINSLFSHMTGKGQIQRDGRAGLALYSAPKR